ncbi:hypothetical protein GTV15_07130 [Streptomyces sp. SID7803]|nr:hypothetical protein [Streptomyces sp. SID7803]
MASALLWVGGCSPDQMTSQSARAAIVLASTIRPSRTMARASARGARRAAG